MVKTELRAHRQPWQGNVAFYLVDRSQPGQTAIGTQVTMEDLPEGYLPPNPTFTLSEGDAQALVEELWVAGFRPRAATPSNDTLAMQGKHLADMRAIAFSKLNIESPKP